MMNKSSPEPRDHDTHCTLFGLLELYVITEPCQHAHMDPKTSARIDRFYIGDIHLSSLPYKLGLCMLKLLVGDAFKAEQYSKRPYLRIRLTNMARPALRVSPNGVSGAESVGSTPRRTVVFAEGLRRPGFDPGKARALCTLVVVLGASLEQMNNINAAHTNIRML